MALSTELINRLERNDEPLAKRLKLAENAYCSMDLAITSKENLIVNWLCKVAPLDFVVWNTMNLCIHCQASNNRNALNNRAKKQLVDTVIEKLELMNDDVTNETVLDCCNGILSNPGMQLYFQSALDSYGHLLSSIFNHIRFNSLKNSANDEETVLKLSDSGLNCVINAIESFVQMYKQHSQKDQVAAVFLDHVLSPFCALIDPYCSDNSNRIGAAGYKCMQQVLFGKSRHTEYEEYSQGKEGDHLPAKLFSTLDGLVKNLKADHVCVMLSYVFRAAKNSYKSSGALVDYFFRRFIDSVGDFKTVVANSLIKYFTDINLQFENKIADITLTQYLGNLIENTLKRERFSSNDYELLRNIAGLNPLIIENKLPAVFKRILLENKSSESEQQSYVELMISILDASSRLRREQKLVPWLLLALQAALTEDGNSELSAMEIFPQEFTCKFTALVGSLQSSQIVAMLKSLTFHLKSNCVDQHGETSLTAECTVQLLVSFFNGIRIFEHSVPVAMQKKFAIALGELGVVLEALNDKILKTKHNERMTTVLLEAALCWSQVHSVLVYYAPNSEAGNIPFPIPEDGTKQLIQRIEDSRDADCKKALNNFLLHRTKVNIIYDIRPRLPALVGGLEYSWLSILSDHTELIPLLNTDQLSELADMVLKDIVKSERNVENWEEILGADNVQENQRFVTAILCRSLTKIGASMKGSISSTITSRIDLIKILDDDEKEDAPVPALDRDQLIKIIPEFSNLSETRLSKIEKYLQALLYLPLRSLSNSLRTMTLVSIYVIRRECEKNERIKSLSDNILFESLEEGGLKISEYIDLASLVPSLPGSTILQKVFEASIRGADVSSSLTELVDPDECPDEAVPVVLSCIENIKPKLNNSQKTALSKVEKKLGKQALNIFGKDVKFADQTRGVTSALKIAIGQNKVKKILKKQVRAMLDSTFMDDDVEKNLAAEDREEVIKAVLDLAAVALQHRARLELSEEIVAGIWRVVPKHPQPKLLTPLLDASVPKVFSEALTLLHNQVVKELQDSNVDKLTKTLSIWHCIVKTDMGAQRNKSRLNVTRKLVQTFEMSEINSDHWPSLVKLLQAIVNSKHMQLSGGYIDMLIMVAAKAMREAQSLAVCNRILDLCLALLKSRNEMMLDRLQTFLFLYRPTITVMKNEAKNETDRDDNMLGLCGLNLEKVTSALIKHKRHMARLSPYLLSDLVILFAEGDLQPVVKEPFKNCVNSLMSICDGHGMALIRRALPTASSEIFKEMSNTYNKFHRYTGKV